MAKGQKTGNPESRTTGKPAKNGSVSLYALRFPAHCIGKHKMWMEVPPVWLSGFPAFWLSGVCPLALLPLCPPMLGMVARTCIFHVSRFTFHVSRFTFHASRFTFHASRFTFHVSRRQNWVEITALLNSAMATVPIPTNPVPQAKPAARTGLNIYHRFIPNRFII